jgi:hypothetical protein
MVRLTMALRSVSALKAESRTSGWSSPSTLIGTFAPARPVVPFRHTPHRRWTFIGQLCMYLRKALFPYVNGLCTPRPPSLPHASCPSTDPLCSIASLFQRYLRTLFPTLCLSFCGPLRISNISKVRTITYPCSLTASAHAANEKHSSPHASTPTAHSTFALTWMQPSPSLIAIL